MGPSSLAMSRGENGIMATAVFLHVTWSACTTRRVERKCTQVRGIRRCRLSKQAAKFRKNAVRLPHHPVIRGHRTILAQLHECEAQNARIQLLHDVVKRLGIASLSHSQLSTARLARKKTVESANVQTI